MILPGSIIGESLLQANIGAFSMSFDSLGLSAELLRAVSEQGYTEPTPIQLEAIPLILEGHDIMGGAQTGTGKTAGFTLPLLHLLSKNNERAGKRSLRALILTPTRELAAQIGESVAIYGKHLPLKSTVIFGGVSMHPQIVKLRQGVDILISTPGRLLDHVNQKTIDLSKVNFLVLDEADRMLDMGFIRDVRKILSLLPKKRQNLLFSATFSKEITRLADEFLQSPITIEVARKNIESEFVTQLVHPVDRAKKAHLLSHLIDSNNWNQVLVFMRTKHGANRLAKQLQDDGIGAVAIHGNKTQFARKQALENFKKLKVRVLVATDIASRGLDIDQLPQVINFDLPDVPEDYVHRVGRTGRAGKQGEARSFVCSDEHILLRDIERLLKRQLQKVVIEGFEPKTPLKSQPIIKRQDSNQKSERPGYSDDRRRAVFGEAKKKNFRTNEVKKKSFRSQDRDKKSFYSCDTEKKLFSPDSVEKKNFYSRDRDKKNFHESKNHSPKSSKSKNRFSSFDKFPKRQWGKKDPQKRSHTKREY